MAGKSNSKAGGRVRSSCRAAIPVPTGAVGAGRDPAGTAPDGFVGSADAHATAEASRLCLWRVVETGRPAVRGHRGRPSGPVGGRQRAPRGAAEVLPACPSPTV
ncbi:hypothetical protein FRACA_530034 [Frankia canadensis]|uniref:Uncharacterized protein n=1 Tax=Frankia canadensis TaxID=1836972 RepID=A0A2I2KYR9_9ACTN|nr:hypothetical protein FRACA_530034 [Frankia canadensis]SOU58101.1 hypothetical protein FRACA_530034 [Frankia canadensis]